MSGPESARLRWIANVESFRPVRSLSRFPRTIHIFGDDHSRGSQPEAQLHGRTISAALPNRVIPNAVRDLLLFDLYENPTTGCG